MDNFYKFPWGIQKGTYREGDKRISIMSADCGYVADVCRKTAHSSESDWETIATLLAISPKLLAIAKAVATGNVTNEVRDLAQYMVEQIVVEESKGFDFWGGNRENFTRLSDRGTDRDLSRS